MNIHFRAFDGPSDWGWVNQQVGILQVEDMSGIMAIDADTNQTVGACIFDNWTSNSVQSHFMLTNPLLLKHGFIEECFDYAFNHSDKKFIYGFIPGDNEKAIKLNLHMGFTEILRLPEAFRDGVDYVVMELKRENCKYLRKIEAA